MDYKHNNNIFGKTGIRVGGFALAAAVVGTAFLATATAQAVDTITINSELTASLEIGAIQNPSANDTEITVTTNGSVFVTDGDNPNALRAYLGQGASFGLNNSGLLDGIWGVFAYVRGTGDVTINNAVDGSIYAGLDYAVYAMTDSGNISVNNAGFMSGSAENASETYRGVVSMDSAAGGSISFINSGMVTGKQFGGGGTNMAPAVVNANTTGRVTIHNTGTIQAVAGENASSGYIGTGIYIDSAVSGGSITNVGGTIIVGDGTAIHVLGSNVDVDLRSSGDIFGSVVLAGGDRNNSLTLDSNGTGINGDVVLGDGNKMNLLFASANLTTPFLTTTGFIDLAGGDLNINFNGMRFEAGDSYHLLHAGDGIYGWMASINGLGTDGVYDPNQIYQLGGMEVSFELTNGGRDLMMNVVSAVPEPSTYAVIFGAVVSGVILLRRRRAAARA